MVDKKLMAIVEKETGTLPITLLVNGLVLFGTLIKEEQFFIESLRIYQKQVKAPSSGWMIDLEDFVANNSRSMQDDQPFIHLSGVQAFVSGLREPISLPALRISVTQVSAWMFGFSDKDTVTARVIEDQFEDLKSMIQGNQDIQDVQD